jgi:hypothetical protein
MVGIVTDIVRDEADKLLSEMETEVYSVSGLRQSFVGILVKIRLIMEV